MLSFNILLNAPPQRKILYGTLKGDTVLNTTYTVHIYYPEIFCGKVFFADMVKIWYTVFPRNDAVATIYFSATAMWHLFEGGAYSRAAFNSVTGTHV